mmetsp:Transcript_28678/g.69471  ORF Transcript_28678/g.69471 Transcript_28678/m.69471 type:complete len:86 (-) Transcript_28678:156-413(-)
MTQKFLGYSMSTFASLFEGSLRCTFRNLCSAGGIIIILPFLHFGRLPFLETIYNDGMTVGRATLALPFIPFPQGEESSIDKIIGS